MNTLEKLNLSQPLTDVYTAMETDIMMAIARQLARDGNISSTSEWRIKKLAESGNLSRETAKIIASYTGIQSDMLTLTLETAAAKVSDRLEPALKAVAKDGFIELKDSTPISAGMAKVVSSFRKQAKSDLNLVNTVMQYKANSSYTNLVNKIYTESTENRNELLAVLGKHTLEVASGAETRQAAIRNCIKEFSHKGIPAFVDRAGREWSPEAYISMDIRTTVGNTANAAQDACCDRYGIDLFEVSSHMGARPKCAPYQGKIISRSNRSGITHDGNGNEIPFIPLSSTSYGEPDGLFGIRCGHNKYPWIDGVNFQTYYPYDKEQNAKRYNEFKQQRHLERRVRDSTREVNMMKLQNDPEGLKAAKEKLKQRREEYSKYSEDHDLHEHSDRASVVRIRKGDDVFGKIYTNPLDNGGGKGYNKSGSDNVHISAIEQPIEQQHTGKGNPNAILIFDTSLNNRQQKLLDSLPEYDSRIIVPKKSVNMSDLSALTAKTGDEYAMFTKGSDRLIIRGNSKMVNIGISDAKQFAEQGYKWSGHTHPGIGINVSMPSSGDKDILKCFNQEQSVIYDSKGNFRTFEKED